MSVGAYGAMLGLLVAAVDFLLLRALARRVELPETKRVLNITGASQFVLLPVIGYFVAPLIVGE
jgi:ABC-type spermidine/putrescine transport system permease subunit I